MADILEVKNLKKYFKINSGQLHAVDDVTFSIQKGKTLGVVGESGCGKSTLGRTVLHLLESTDGQIFFDGEDVTHVDAKKLRKLREKMQIIFQDPFSSLNPRMSVSTTIAEPLELSGRFGKAEIGSLTDQLMDTVGLAPRLRNSYPHELDGGRRQRIGIARALALEPDFIVCDEPVSALDVSIQAQILNLLMDLKDEFNFSYLFIAHDLSVVRHISDRLGVMYLGSIVEMGDKHTLFTNPVHPYTKVLFAAVPTVGEKPLVQGIDAKGEIPSPVNLPKGCYFSDRCPYATDRCRQEKPVLREVEPGHMAACHLL